MLLLGYTIVALACGLIFDVVIVSAHWTLPLLAQPGSFLFWVLFAVLCVVSFGVVFNYFAVVAVAPGGVPAGYTAAMERQWRRILQNGPAPQWLTPPRFCRLCNEVKPPRSHHCLLCGTCVLKQDHHCPWVAGCIGYHNQRYFLFFLVYMMFGTGYCGVGSALVMWCDRCLREEVREDARLIRESTLFFFTFVLCATICVAMMLFVGWNAWMALTNQTAIEYQINRDCGGDGWPSREGHLRVGPVASEPPEPSPLLRGTALDDDGSGPSDTVPFVPRNRYDFGFRANVEMVAGVDTRRQSSRSDFPWQREGAGGRWVSRDALCCFAGNRSHQQFSGGGLKSPEPLISRVIRGTFFRGGILWALCLAIPTLEPMPGDGTDFPEVWEFNPPASARSPRPEDASSRV